ncbi:unnamed protein product [Mytilus coruscus]|uniref:Uncharacterized protein n=1 Tax=Mytilus coruscus TaxID=42192 RepID=A0A6J8CJL6_MYTCO|nr:unnamed protein product [Mytilus coruscus]
MEITGKHGMEYVDLKRSKLYVKAKLVKFWIKDVPGHLDDNDVNNGANGSLNTRSKTGDMEGPLCHDLFHMDRYILNQVAINVRLTRTRPEFCLMTNEVAPDFKVIIEDIVLKACKIQINPAVIYGHAEILKSVNAKYPFTKTEVKQITVAAGTVNFAQDQLFQTLDQTE